MKLPVKILTSIILIINTVLFISCEDTKKNNEVLEMINEDINNKANTQFITDIADLNLKIVGITELTNRNSLDSKTTILIDKIKKHHEGFNKKIKTIARNNLIIIPDTLYESSLIIDSANTDKNYEYLVTLEKLMKAEIEEYELIIENTNNPEIESLAENAIQHINYSLNEIDNVLNNY